MIRWLLGLVMVLGPACVAHPPPAPPRQTQLGIKISSLTLSNGLRVVQVHDPRAPEVQVTMRYQVGSIDDPRDQPGMAHLVEHLMFQQVVGAQSVFSKLGAIASHFNATTSLDATTYVARAQPSRLDELLAIEAIRLGHRCTSISDAVFAREREVVINELRLRDPVRSLWHTIHEAAYPPGHPYQRFAADNEATVSAITREQACAFADAHYAPRNAVLVVSGNIAPARLEASLRKWFGRLPNRDVATPAPVPRLDTKQRAVKTPAAIDEPVVLFSWPLPDDPAARIRMRAIATTAVALVDNNLKGSAVGLELGDDRAPLQTIAVLPGDGETADAVMIEVQHAIAALPIPFRERRTVLSEIGFNTLQQGALYKLFASLEEDSDRDARLAAATFAGRDPAAMLAIEMQSLRELSRGEAATIVTDYMGFERATIVVLEPGDDKKRGRRVELATPIHDLGQRRDPPDPAEARAPANVEIAARELGAMTRRELPNGLDVVLLPITSVPTVDVRLIFGSGTADEPAHRRGAALVAGYALSWQPRHINDLLAFTAAGGSRSIDVGMDSTSFSARGLDMHLDYLLAGLRRMTRDGIYDGDAKHLVDAIRADTKRLDDAGAITDAWRAALYGARHPYVRASLPRHITDALGLADVERFRAEHYTPANATLVIAGRFDPVVANRWIDFLFGDWTGTGSTHGSARPEPAPASLAYDAQTVQVAVEIAIPAATGTRAQQLVAAAMLDEIAGDVRHQLGAAYTLHAQLSESRQATVYWVSGWVDVARSREAIELLRARLEGLKSDEAAARAFVTARVRVIAKLAAGGGSATALADHVHRDIDLGRTPLSDLQTATAVRDLTIDEVAPVLAELDLARATVLLRGPAAQLDAAFAALGRTPTYVQANQVEIDAREDPDEKAAKPAAWNARYAELSLSDISDALTEQGPSSWLAVTVAPSFTAGKVIETGVSGWSVAADVGYRFDRTNGVGLHLSIGDHSGTYDVGTRFVPDLRPVEVMPVVVAGFLQASGYDRLWGSVFLGAHFDRVTDDNDPPAWSGSFALGVAGGVDIVSFRRNRLSAYGRVDGQVGGWASYTGLSIGVAYRR